MRHIGIDLGTSNSLMAEVIEKENGNHEVVCLKNNLGKYSFPSVLSFADREKCYFGYKAEERLLTNPKSTVSMIKTRIGNTIKIPVEINNIKYEISPQEISAKILKQIIGRYGDNLNRAVLTKPANYGVNQNYALKEIVELAQFNVVEMIEEPSAAIMYHLFKGYNNRSLNLNNFDEGKQILVFDFGGGTLDLSLVTVKKEQNGLSTKVLFNDGECNLGGGIIDLLFEKFILERLSCKNPERFEKIYDEFMYYYDNYTNGRSLSFRLSADINDIKFIYKLRKILEEIKISLSSKEKATIEIDGIDPIEIKREDFENYILAPIENEIAIKEKIRKLINNVSLFAFKKNYKIYQIIFVGGTSNIPYIRRLVINELKSLINDFNENNVYMSDDYDCAVVKGAAILCAIHDGLKISPFNSDVCQTIVSRKIEIEYLGERQIIVNEGEEYPFTKNKEILFKIKNSLAPYQTLVFNEIEEYNDGAILRKKVLDFNFYLPIYYTNDEVKLEFNIDKNGLYRMKLKHVFTGDEIDYEHLFVGALNAEGMKNTGKI